eukprot:gene14009-15467_t
MKINFEECYGNEPVRSYEVDFRSTRKDVPLTVAQVEKRSQTATDHGLSRLRRFFKTVFLPQGYPDSVSGDYLEYQIWDTAQAFCSSITGTLATQAMLKGYGVGDKNATVAAAAITWLLKDGTGMLGRIVFAWMKGTQLDCDAKRWRLFADILNDFSILLDLISPVFKTYFTFIVCVSGVSKSIVGVAGGATRAALTQHQALRDNMADVSAKDGSQETLVNLTALLAGLVITPLVSNNPALVWTMFIIFTFLHLFCNYKAVSAVVMETVNLPRYHILYAAYMQSRAILKPKEVAEQDPVILQPGYKLQINLGCKLSKVLYNTDEFNYAVESIQNTKYIMRLNLNNDKASGSLNIVLHRDISTIELLKCCFHAFIIDALVQDNFDHSKLEATTFQAAHLLQLKQKLSKDSLDDKFSRDIVTMTHNTSVTMFPAFYEGLKRQGWDMGKTQFGPDEWRIDCDSTTDIKSL